MIREFRDQSELKKRPVSNDGPLFVSIAKPSFNAQPKVPASSRT